MKKIVAFGSLLTIFLFSFTSSVLADSPTPLTITRTEPIEYSDPNQYRLAVYFTPKINTLLPQGGHFSGCSFVYNTSNFEYFDQVGWDNDASETESRCIFMQSRPTGANNVLNYTGKLHIGGGLSSILFDPVGLSNNYTISVPGKPIAPVFSSNLGEQQALFGQTYIREFSFSDQDSTSWTVSITYGDGTSEQLTLNETNFTLNHIYQDFGRYELLLTITDNHGMSKSASGYVSANYERPIGNGLVPPSAVVSSSGFSSPENIFVKDDGNVMNKIADTASITVSFDSLTSANNIHSFHVTPYFEASEAPDGLICHASINTDKGVFYALTPFANPNCGYGSGGGGDNAHFSFELPNDVHRIDSLTYTITSPEGSYFPLQLDYFETSWFGSVYDKPEVNPGGPYEVAKGESITLQGSATRINDVPPSNVIHYSWDLDNDGSYETSGNNHVFSTTSLDAGVYVVGFTALKDVQYTGLYASPVKTTITVTDQPNFPPAASSITAPTAPTQINTSLNASASFTDDNTSDTHTAVWDWGDGSTSNGTVNELNGSGTVSDSHVYTAAGVYTITLTVTDNLGASSNSLYQYAVVYDSSTKTVSGSKEFNSPAGAIAANPTATGKASFGFTAKYDSAGNPIPVGNKWASLDFKQGNTTLSFEATSYQWLVVNGAKAVLKGSGKLNNVSGYSVLISSIEGSNGGADYVRYQIKDSSGNVVYDTQSGAADTADPTTIVSKGKITIK